MHRRFLDVYVCIINIQNSEYRVTNGTFLLGVSFMLEP